MRKEVKSNEFSYSKKTTIDMLYKNMGDNISSMYPSLLSTIYLYEILNATRGESDKTTLWTDLLRIYYYILFCHLDIATVLRAELRSENVWNKRINLKYLNVVQTEFFKAMFGFGKNRQVLWKKFCDDAGDTLDGVKRKEIEDLVEKYKQKYLGVNSKDSRDFAIHYDFNPIKIYECLVKLSEENEIKKVSMFLDISCRLLQLVTDILKILNLPIGIKPIEEYSFWEKLNQFPDEGNRLLLQARQKSVFYSKTLDRLINEYKLPDIIEKKLGLDNIHSEVQPIIESVLPGIHLIFIYMDICNAVIAYLSSEYYVEKQLNLRHINVIVYEGFKKLYGSNGDSVGQATNDDVKEHVPFWNDILFPTIMNSDNNLWKLKAIEIQIQLDELAQDKFINDAVLRHMSVHIRNKKKKDFIPLLTLKLIKMNPMAEMFKALTILKVLPKVMKLNEEVMRIRYATIMEHQNKKKEKQKLQIENIRDCLHQKCKNEMIKRTITDSINEVLSLLDEGWVGQN